MATTRTSIQLLRILHQSAAEQWAGCNWQTAFGSRNLNLQGVRSRQAHLLAEATSGTEAASWEEASRWLIQVETDARLAARHGERALFSFEEGDYGSAVAEADAAVLLESKYRDAIAWTPFRNAIAGQ